MRVLLSEKCMDLTLTFGTNMNNIKLIILMPILFFLVGCGGGGKANNSEEIRFFSEDTLSLLEGARYKVSLNNKEKIKEVVLTIVDEQQDVFFIKNGINAELVIPNVDKEVSFQIQASVIGIDDVKYAEIQTINVVPVDIEIPNVIPTPNVFAGTVGRYENVIFDYNLVPLLNYNGELVYSPTYIAMYAYNYYLQYYVSKDSEDREKFLNAALWLKDNCVYTEFGFCSFRFNFPVASWEVTEDWTSAMAQGQALSSLIAAAYITNDISYTKVAYDALAAFQYPVELKGVSSYAQDTVWFEEYGSESFKSGVLNGFIFSMSGIRSFTKSYPELALSNFLFNAAIEALEIRLPLFDNGFTSHYNCSPDLAKDQCLIASAKGSRDVDAYHELHVYQLGWLSGIADSDIIDSYFSSFLSYDFGPFTGATVVEDSGLQLKFRKLTASHTIDPESFGVDWLTDENWTYGRYWSSSRSYVYLDIELNKDFLDTKHLDKIVLSSMSMDAIPNIMDVYYIDPYGVEQFVSSHTINDAYDVMWNMQTSNYTSVTLTIPVDKTVETENIRLYFQGGGIIALRELNFLYERARLQNVIMNVYPYR